MNVQICDQLGNCCETLIENNGTNLQRGSQSKFTGDQIRGCTGKNLDTSGNINIVVEKPGIDGWRGSFVE